MRRLTKRGLILGIAGLMMVIGVGTASSVSANTSCAGADTKMCNSEERTYILSGFLNQNVIGDFGDAATNLAPTGAQRNGYDSLVIGSGDRIPNS
jgi:hypothetical protein